MVMMMMMVVVVLLLLLLLVVVVVVLRMKRKFSFKWARRLLIYSKGLIVKLRPLFKVH